MYGAMRLVYLSPVPWDSFDQRPHQFVEWCRVRHGASVLWIDPYPTRLPDASDLRRLCRLERPVAACPPRGHAPGAVRVLRPRSFPVEPLPGLRQANRPLWRGVLREVDAFVSGGGAVLGVGKPSRLALEILSRHPGVPSFYDAMDNFPAFYTGLSRRSMQRCESAVEDRADRIVVSSTELSRRFARHAGRLSKALNACASDRLPQPRLAGPPDARPVLGYVGTIGHWFDWGLVTSLAEANPRVSVRLVGPVHVPPPGPLPGNVELLPPRAHAEALLLMREFSAGLIPFKLTELTASVDPIKYYEYRSLGLPVVSTGFGEMALRRSEPGVFILDGDAHPSRIAEAALSWRCGVDEVMDFRAENSWEARFDASFVLP